MNCRKDWKKVLTTTKVDHTLSIRRQAQTAESRGNWAQASIFWRRVNNSKDADRCEQFAQEVAETGELLVKFASE